MESRASRTSRKPLLLGALVLCGAVLGGIVSKVYEADRKEFSLTEFCKGQSERPRLACMNMRPADASPMPPQG